MITYPYTDDGVLLALHALGATASEVAANLFALDYRGKRGSESQDPLARYLVASIKDAASAEVIVEGGGLDEAHAIVSRPNYPDVAADLPRHVRAFVLEFDDGKHHELIEDGPDAA